MKAILDVLPSKVWNASVQMLQMTILSALLFGEKPNQSPKI